MSQNIKSYIKKYGTSYYRANLFFPKEIRDAVYHLYAFVRIPDQFVDEGNLSGDEAEKKIKEFQNNRWKVVKDKNYEDEQFGEFLKIYEKYEIEADWIDSFFEAMIADCSKKRYETYEELQDYMYGSAEVIGLMMTKIIGGDNEAINHARKLGEAMQLTNFLRDIKEDYEILDRIYMPKDELGKYGLSTKHIKEFCETKEINSNFEAFMQHMINKAEKLYHEAEHGIKFLNPKGRKAVFLASRLYQQILKNIKKNNYNVFSKSMKTSKRQKFGTILKSLVN